jgi:hypothetical protein
VIDDLDKAISHQEKAVSLTPKGHVDESLRLNSLAGSFFHRVKHHHEKADIDQVLSTYKAAANCVAGNPMDLWDAARRWATVAYDLRGVQDSLEAHQTVIRLIPRVVWVGTTVTKRFNDITKLTDSVSNAVAAALEDGNLSLAMEWLEQGRSVIWGQLLSLRTPLDDLHDLDPLLATQLKQVGRELESGIEGGSSNAAKKQYQSLELQAQRQRRLAAEWEELIGRARLLPGLETFLLPRSFSTLRNATHCGSIVLVNVHERRCDAIVLRDSADIQHVPLPALSVSLCEKLCVALQGTLKHYRDSERATQLAKPSTDLKRLLSTLWTTIVTPVLKALEIPLVSC